MSLDFRRGDAERPRGHAIVYFDLENDAVAGCYVVIPPIAIDLAKYLPPMFAGRVDLSETQQLQAVPLPPVPERVPSLRYLEQLAELRDDDLIAGGRVSDQMESLVHATSDLASRYLSLYQSSAAALSEASGTALTAEELDVSDVLYGMMSDSSRVSELAKLTGKLRYAMESADGGIEEETVEEIHRVGAYFPESYRIDDFLRAARQRGEDGERLAALYLDRCYKLAAEDYAGIAEIETRIRLAEQKGTA